MAIEQPVTQEFNYQVVVCIPVMIFAIAIAQVRLVTLLHSKFGILLWSNRAGVRDDGS